MRWLIIALFLALPAMAHGQDIQLLQRIICEYETRGILHKDQATGRDGEIGYCQIKLGTARMFFPRITIAKLRIRSVNITVAQTILLDCKLRHWRGVYGLSYCYTAGRQSGRLRNLEAHVYGRRMETRYATAKLIWLNNQRFGKMGW